MFANHISQGSTSGQAAIFRKKNEVCICNPSIPASFSEQLLQLPREVLPKLASLGTRNVALAGSSKIQLPFEKSERLEQQINDAKKISPCSEHFRYIATMTSFKDLHFRHTIWKDLVENPVNSWEAFNSLSPDLVLAFLVTREIIAKPIIRKMHPQTIGRSSWINLIPKMVIIKKLKLRRLDA
jgi:hypothetical protein